MSRKLKFLAAAAVVLLAIAGYVLLAGGGKGHQPEEKDQDQPVPVTVAPVSMRDVPVYLTALGTAQARNTVTVRPQVQGRLLDLSFEEGGAVAEGQVLARIDPAPYQARYDQAVANLKQAKAQLATARGNFKRGEELIRKNYISEQDLNELSNKLHQMEASVAASAANARDAKIELDYTSVESPMDAIAGIRMADVGNVVSGNDAIVVLTQVRPINVMFSLPAKQIDQVRAAAARHSLPVAALDAADRHVLAGDGQLEVIDNRIDASTGTFSLKAEFPNQKVELWPGQFVNVRMQLDTIEDGLVVPLKAVQRGPDGEFVYLLKDDNTVAVQPIETGHEADAEGVLVVSGLAAGDKVVTEGQFRLKPGSKVKPMAPGEVPELPTEEEIAKLKKESSGGGHGH